MLGLKLARVVCENARVKPPHSAQPVTNPAPRLWPVLVLLVLMVVLRTVPALLAEQTMASRLTLFLGPPICVLLMVVWWLFLSRIPWRERLLGLGGLVLIVIASVSLLERSISEGFDIIAGFFPSGMAAFVLGFAAAHRLPGRRRILVALVAALLGFGVWTLVRSEGVSGDFSSEYHWRWEQRPEERILADLARRDSVPTTPGADDALLIEAGWPGFRGPGRDGVVPGLTLAEDWNASPPREMWRIPVGPGWSSFAVAGQRLFTQEQRGGDEVVVCYDAATGAEVWNFSYPSRFWESQGGVGPRATPTLRGNGLFAQGAEGLLHRLDPATGEMIWQVDLRADAGREAPVWGFSSSPLVLDDLVVVYAGGEGDRGVLAYGADDGALRWGAPAGAHSYSSPQLLTVAGAQAIAMATDAGMGLLDPADGSVLMSFHKETQYRILQPLVVGDASLLMNNRLIGTSRLDLDHENGQLTARERWTSRSMKSDFSDYVAYQGNLYGFDINIFACIDLETGDRRWKGGRYGHGQVLLLPDAGQLLVLTEDGEVVLLRADPEQHEERARLPVLHGKTWNHPALVGSRLYLRNSEEAVALELATAP